MSDYSRLQDLSKDLSSAIETYGKLDSKEPGIVQLKRICLIAGKIQRAPKMVHTRTNIKAQRSAPVSICSFILFI